jgi:hypothetical protein
VQKEDATANRVISKQRDATIYRPNRLSLELQSCCLLPPGPCHQHSGVLSIRGSPSSPPPTTSLFARFHSRVSLWHARAPLAPSTCVHCLLSPTVTQFICVCLRCAPQLHLPVASHLSRPTTQHTHQRHHVFPKPSPQCVQLTLELARTITHAPFGTWLSLTPLLTAVLARQHAQSRRHGLHG